MSKVGLIDDERSIRELLKTLLELEGFDVVVFDQSNEKTLLAAVETECPDILILDVHLRYANGLDLLSQIRQNKNLRNLLVVMSSGMDYSHRCLQSGANAFIMKPYMPDDLIAILREQLARQD